MFRSLTSLIFGSNTSEITKQEQDKKEPDQLEQQQQQLQVNATDTENTIELTSSTPSVSGENSINRLAKRGKNSRNNNRRKGKKQQQQQQQQRQQDQTKPQTANKKLLTFNDDDTDEDLDEDDWLIVEKESEDEQEDVLPHVDSKEELPIVEEKPAPEVVAVNETAATTAANAAAAAAALRHRHNICTHSLYSGPRPQQQRNYLQRARNSGTRIGRRLSVSALSPPRVAGVSDGKLAVEAAADAAGGGVTQSLYAAPLNISNGGGSDSGNESVRNPMEESWFVTPPPCFTSIGPIHMETSPFENLLIEHPSMSVYYSIRSAQEAAESFVSLDLGVKESQKREELQKQQQQKVVLAEKNTAIVPRRTAQARLDRYNIAQLKQELLARNNQKSHDMHERRQSVCRGAIKRANKARDYQSKSNRQRRSEMQHFKLVSGYNNNRKSSKQQQSQKSRAA